MNPERATFVEYTMRLAAERFMPGVPPSKTETANAALWESFQNAVAEAGRAAGRAWDAVAAGASQPPPPVSTPPTSSAQPKK